MHGSMALRLRIVAVSALASFGIPLLAQAQPSAPTPAEFFRTEALRIVSYRFPDSSWPNTLSPLCALARDIPLVRDSGATAIYTKGAPPDDGDHIFLSLLASTDLRWVAAYPLPEEVDSTLPLMSQKELILSRFASFAERFQDNPSLRAIVLDFGKQHLVESALMAGDFAEILRTTIPERTPFLGQVAYDPESLYYTPTGIQFWLYRFQEAPPAAADRIAVEGHTGIPLVYDLSQVANPFAVAGSADEWATFLASFSAGDPAPGIIALEFMGEREIVSESTAASEFGPSTVISSTEHPSDAMFIGLRDEDLFENLSPTPLAMKLRDHWDSAPLEVQPPAPVLREILNEATGTQYLSPGTRARISGTLLAAEDSTLSTESWPLHAGATCLCASGRPVPMGELTAIDGVVQLPWLMKPGVVEARFVREGIASRPLLVDVVDVSPGVYPRKIERSDAGCSVSDSDGVRPGETIRIEATGTGPLNGDTNQIQAILNETPAEVLYAGLSAETVGISELLVKVPVKLTPGDRVGLFLRRGNRASNLIPIHYVGNARPTVGLVAERERILVQPGGLSAPVLIQTNGLNGYCGPVEFSVDGLPKGLTAIISPVSSGQAASLQIRADSFAEVAEDVPVYLHALPTPGDLATLALKVKVMPRAGSMTLTIESRGFNSGASASIMWNGELLPPTGLNAARGIYLMVIDPKAGIFYPVERYDIWQSEDESTRLEVRLNSLRNGMLVALAIADDATLHMQPSLKSWLTAKLGSTAIASLAYRSSWAIVGEVGSSSPLAEGASADTPVQMQRTLTLPSQQ